MQTASKNLMETLSDIYEKEWVGQDMLYVQVVYMLNVQLKASIDMFYICTGK